MTKQEVRQRVVLELRRRGIENAEAVSNKDACKLLGLMPDNVIGIGGAKGGRMLKAWITGNPVSYEELGGFKRGSVQKHSKETVIRKAKRARKSFYETREWREVRYQALLRCGAKCNCCGRTKNDGAILHVDHIKPRSKYPELELDISNLQVLCEDCNFGKSNKDETDWRITA